MLVSNSRPAGSLLVLDRRTILAASSPIRLDRSEDAYFSSDVIGVRIVWRLGWAVQEPERLVKIDTAATP